MLGGEGLACGVEGFLAGGCGIFAVRLQLDGKDLAVKGHVLNDTVTLLPGDAFCCHRVHTAHPDAKKETA